MHLVFCSRQIPTAKPLLHLIHNSGLSIGIPIQDTFTSSELLESANVAPLPIAIGSSYTELTAGPALAEQCDSNECERDNIPVTNTAG